MNTTRSPSEMKFVRRGSCSVREIKILAEKELGDYSRDCPIGERRSMERTRPPNRTIVS